MKISSFKLFWLFLTVRLISLCIRAENPEIENECLADDDNECLEVLPTDIEELEDEKFVTQCKEGAYFRAPSSVFVIPDVHGDIYGFVSALKMANAINEDYDWTGGNLTIVQLGDIFDRGGDTLQIIKFTLKLQKQALEVGGCYIQLMGNHEMMNLIHDFRYASEKETSKFGGEEQRKKALEPNHFVGKFLRNLRAAVTVEHDDASTLFVHAGLTPDILKIHSNSLDVLNAFVQDTMETLTGPKLSRKIFADRVKFSTLADDGPLWSRYFARRAPDTDTGHICKKLQETLDIVGVDRMIVGHTVQEELSPSFKCGEKLILADIGLSKFYGSGRALIKILEDGEVVVVNG